MFLHQLVDHKTCMGRFKINVSVFSYYKAGPHLCVCVIVSVHPLQNPVVHFELPLRLERWFSLQQVRRKREDIRELVLQLYRQQGAAR